MPTEFVVAILIAYPLAALITPVAFFTLWPEEARQFPSLPSEAATPEEKAASVRVGVRLPLMFCAALLLFVVVLTLVATPILQELGFTSQQPVSSLLRGGYLGISWAGMWLWAWVILSNPARLQRDVPGLGAPLRNQAILWTLSALSVETWRCVSIVALVHSGYSPTFSVAASAATFGIVYLLDSWERSILAVLEGAIFGVLFLWQGTILAPLAAHLAVEGVYLWGIGQFSLEKTAKKGRGLRCSNCGARLNRLQVKMSEAFRCPACHEILSVSDRYRGVTRWVSVFTYMLLFVCSLAFLYGEIQQQDGGLAIWLVWPLAWGAGTSAVFIYQRIFPPILQTGDPHFIRMDLNPLGPPGSDDHDD